MHTHRVVFVCCWVLCGFGTGRCRGDRGKMGNGAGWSHDDVIKWKHFPRYWPFVRGIHRSPVDSPHKSQWRGALIFSLICALNKRLSKQSWGWWFETPSCSLWRHCNDMAISRHPLIRWLKVMIIPHNMEALMGHVKFLKTVCVSPNLDSRIS